VNIYSRQKRHIIYKKLDESKIEDLINAGIEEFSQKGISGGSLSNIAKKAGLSVGVIYKYYEDKNSLFLACVRYSLEKLSNLLDEVLANEEDFELCVGKIIHVLIESSSTDQKINKMYNTISSREADIFAKELADEIEGISAKVYTELITKAQHEGKINPEANPALFAFFFDSLLMMIQFSYSCDYYKERLKIYCGPEIFTNNELMEKELTRFLLSALKK